MKISVPLLSLLILFACRDDKNQKGYLPGQVYHYIKIDTAALINKHSVYVPVYSHIYSREVGSPVNLTAVLSIRNTSYTDSFYVTDIIYYGSQGEVLKRYLDSSLLVKPMASIEFVVERTESKGGAGANFVVKWGSFTTGSEPLIQTVMNETTSGISFVTNGVEMK
ncbi:MAG TPA: DUF3124 domain-containing protein [Chitinophagaceae bacterium]|jgi:hypothetical protein